VKSQGIAVVVARDRVGRKHVFVDRSTTVVVILAAQSLVVSFPAELSCFDNSQNVKMRVIQALLRRSPLFPAS
jgi:hypothetical protein